MKSHINNNTTTPNYLRILQTLPTYTNGNFTYLNNNYAYTIFNSNGSIHFKEDTPCELLIVGAGGRGGKKPPKPPTASAAAPKPSPKPKKPSGGVKKMTRAQKREINVAKHKIEREKFLAESTARSRAAREETRAFNRAEWAKRQDEMEARRLAGREKMNKKKKKEGK